MQIFVLLEIQDSNLNIITQVINLNTQKKFPNILKLCP